MFTSILINNAVDLNGPSHSELMCMCVCLHESELF
jgi:hypothetical protein